MTPVLIEVVSEVEINLASRLFSDIFTEEVGGCTTWPATRIATIDLRRWKFEFLEVVVQLSSRTNSNNLD
jgi:hypothetical protein